MRIDIPKVLLAIRPGALWNLHSFADGTYKIDWMETNSLPAPTDDEIQKGWATIAYKELRKTEYPPLHDFADAYVHLKGGDESAMNAYVDACNAVKAKYPKGA